MELRPKIDYEEEALTWRKWKKGIVKKDVEEWKAAHTSFFLQFFLTQVRECSREDTQKRWEMKRERRGWFPPQSTTLPSTILNHLLTLTEKDPYQQG